MDSTTPINATPPTGSPAESDTKPADWISVIEERVVVGKRVVEAGRVLIQKHVTEHQEHVSVPLNHDEIHVDRVLINRYVDVPPEAVRYEGDTMIISVLEEVVVVEKRLMLVEELHVTKRQIQTEEMQQVTLRKEEVTVTRQPGAVPDESPAQQTN